jgi:hypothetical protein
MTWQLVYLLVSGVRRVRLARELIFWERSLLKVIFRLHGNPGDAWLIGGDLWVWDAENDTWINVGSIKGPQGDPGKAPTFTAAVPVNYKSCGDYTADATVAADGGTTEQPNYKITMEVPQPVRVYKAADNGWQS